MKYHRTELHSAILLKFDLYRAICSDESEPSWLEPELKLKDYQVGSAHDLFPFSSKSKIGQKRAEILILILFVFLLSFMYLNHSLQLPKTPFVLRKFILMIMQLIRVGYNHDTDRKFWNLIVVLD